MSRFFLRVRDDRLEACDGDLDRVDRVWRIDVGPEGPTSSEKNLKLLKAGQVWVHTMNEASVFADQPT